MCWEHLQTLKKTYLFQQSDITTVEGHLNLLNTSFSCPITKWGTKTYIYIYIYWMFGKKDKEDSSLPESAVCHAGVKY